MHLKENLDIETFLKLHRKAALQHPPKTPEVDGDLFQILKIVRMAPQSSTGFVVGGPDLFEMMFVTSDFKAKLSAKTNLGFFLLMHMSQTFV